MKIFSFILSMTVLVSAIGNAAFAAEDNVTVQTILKSGEVPDSAVIISDDNTCTTVVSNAGSANTAVTVVAEVRDAEQRCIAFAETEKFLPPHSSEKVTAVFSQEEQGVYEIEIYAKDENGDLVSNIETFYRWIKGDIGALLKQHPHPRLMLTAQKTQELQTAAETEFRYEQGIQALLMEAERCLEEPVCRYEKPDGIRLLETSRAVLTRTKALGMAYQLTGDERFAQRAWEELHAAAGFPDWNPAHFLDTAEMTAAFAIGYDWLYTYLGETERDKIAQAIVEKGLQEARAEYRENCYGFANASHNWNIVCNAGIAMGALAVGDEGTYASLAGECLDGAFRSVQKFLQEFAPDGGWFEGITYWRYSINYLTMLMSSMDTALGTDFGIFDMDGVSETMLFPIYLNKGDGYVSFGDSTGERFALPELSYFADRFHMPSLKAVRDRQLESGSFGAEDMLWYVCGRTEPREEWKLDKLFAGKGAISTMRSGWDEDALFVSLKGGRSVANHSHLDLGSFVLQADGVQWAEDAGGDDYSLPGYFDTLQKRWEYYRTRAESHNTLVINPGAGADMNLAADCPVSLTEKPKGAYSIADLTSAYPEAVSVKRGVFLKDRERVLVQDELDLKKPSQVYWFMHTFADIELQNGGRRTVLRRNGKELKAEILSPENAAFEVRADAPLASSPQIPGQNLIADLKKLTIFADGLQRDTISVCFSPGEMEKTAVPMEKWSIEDGEQPKLQQIYLDGVPMKDFDPNRRTYAVDWDVRRFLPTVCAQGKYPYTVAFGENTCAVSVWAGGAKKNEYQIRFRRGEAKTQRYDFENQSLEDLICWGSHRIEKVGDGYAVYCGGGVNQGLLKQFAVPAAGKIRLQCRVMLKEKKTCGEIFKIRTQENAFNSGVELTERGEIVYRGVYLGKWEANQWYTFVLEADTQRENSLAIWIEGEKKLSDAFSYIRNLADVRLLFTKEVYVDELEIEQYVGED